ncbi:MAG TPA: aminodeoxychorismate synthase component I [Nitrospinota bacterium]|nr:aminodeoxychorismate synthase component I [Nitrospinota bacterium]
MKELFPLFHREIQGSEDLVILETVKTDSENFKSFVFLHPLCILKTSKIDEVESVLREIEGFLKKGLYVAGYIAYEAGYAFETKLKSLLSNVCFSHPLIWFGVFENPCMIDLRDSKFKWEEYNNLFPESFSYEISGFDLNISEDEYKSKIEQIKNYISSGDTYQINFTWNIHFSFQGSPLALYDDLRKKQRVSYAAYIRSGNTHTISYSPELFFRRSGNKIITRPMKGTMKRGRTLSEDRKNMNLLHNCEKNRAENLMIVDLLRNDLGKISEIGTVKVNKLFEVERYETLFQMTSTVEGELKPKTTYLEIFKSLFPSGSVTGAPKIRSMEIINELEKDHRGIYTGAIGYISPYEEAVFNIAIRTPVIKENKGVMGIGSGIVWDSKAEDEYRECSLKMRFLTEVVQEFKLLETILYYKGKYWLLKPHIQRLKQSAEYFGFSFDSEEFFVSLKQNAEQLDNEERYKVRVLVDKSGKFSIENVKLGISKKDDGFIALSNKKMDSKNIFLFHKTTNRDIYDKLYLKAQRMGLTDLIFTNERGEITEGCISNIFIRRNGKFITPPVDCGLLNGVMRQYILRKRKNVKEDIITLNDLRTSEKIYLCNSVRGIIKVNLSDKFI